MTTFVRTNCPRDCYDGCGILVEIKDADIARVLGDPDHPVSRGKLCSKCAVAYNGVWQDEHARLTTPLRRVGPKGTASFEPISWEIALETIAQRLKEVIATQGADAILHTHYSGTLSLIAYLFPNRFFIRLGASEVDPDTICNAAGHAAWHLLYGNSGVGIDPRTAEDASCILVWGANPAHSAPHAHEYWLPESPAKVVVVDPIRTETAAAADLHLQPRPGTDAALAFALLNALRQCGAFDDPFIQSHTLGYDQIVTTIDGCTPEWGEQQTGVPACQIREAAAHYASGPAILWCGQALQRQTQGGNIMRAVGLLPALAGNVGKPGAGFYYLNDTPAMAGIDLDAMAGAELVADDYAGHEPKSVGHMELAQRLADPDEFRVLFAWNTNPLASAPDQTALRRAFARDDLFCVAIDCFETDTVRYADIVLPAASFLEFDDLTFSYFHLHMGAQSKVREPAGESLPNQEIFRRLAKAMALDEPALYESDENLISDMLNACGVDFDFEQLKEKGYFVIAEETLQPYADLIFDTPSGKIEIVSDQAEAMGLPRTPLPMADAKPNPGHLRLLTPASKWRLNDSYANDPHLRKLAGPASIIINPLDAQRLGVNEGARVGVSNEVGNIELVALIDDIALPGTAISYKGRWPSSELDGANVNFLHAPQNADMANSTSVHSVEVMVKPL